MDRWLHYYAIAEQCEREAAEASRDQTRAIMLEAAAQWRQLGDDAKHDDQRKISKLESSSEAQSTHAGVRQTAPSPKPPG
jgi:hypothetical protein